MEIIFKGALLGFALAFPVGPVGAIVLRIGVAHGPFYGFSAALGAATADAVIGAFAAFGLTQAADWLADHQLEIRLVGIVVMLALAVRLLTAPPIDPANAPDSSRPGLAGPFITTFALVFLNPMTLIAFIGVLAGVGIHELGLTIAEGLTFAGAVFVGAALCWSLVSLTAALFRHRVNGAMMAGINFVTATMLVVFAAMLSVSLLSPEAMPLFATPTR
ncbi:MAG: LysE family transporter [Pseudomonadota bacterium]